MDAQEFRKYAHEAIEASVDYMENINNLPVVPSVKPKFLQKVIPDSAPDEPEDFSDVMRDFNQYIMPGMTHWHSGKFCAYFPAGFSYPSFLGDIYSSMLASSGFNWANSPALTELEYITMEWMGKLLGLDPAFYSGKGHALIQGSASEAVFIVVAAARYRTLKALEERHKADPAEVSQRLVIYASDQCHSCTEKAARILNIRYRALPTDSTCVLRAETVLRAIHDDQRQGLIPIYITSTFGTTPTAAIDDIDGIADICEEHGLWHHVDAAYAGSSLVCPEFRPLAQGYNRADSFSSNMHKWLLVHFDCSLFYTKHREVIKETMSVVPNYQRYREYDEGKVENLSDYQIPMGNRFRALKIWFTVRSYGASGLQRFIRYHIELTALLHHQIAQDDRFEVLNRVDFGLICFRITPAVALSATNQSRAGTVNGHAEDAETALTAANRVNWGLFDHINASGVYLSRGYIGRKFIIRVSIGSFKSDRTSTDLIWDTISRCAREVLDGTVTC